MQEEGEMMQATFRRKKKHQRWGEGNFKGILQGWLPLSTLNSMSVTSGVFGKLKFFDNLAPLGFLRLKLAGSGYMILVQTSHLGA